MVKNSPSIFLLVKLSLNRRIPKMAVTTKLIWDIGTIVLAGPSFRASNNKYMPTNKHSAAPNPKYTNLHKIMIFFSL